MRENRRRPNTKIAGVWIMGAQARKRLPLEKDEYLLDILCILSIRLSDKYLINENLSDSSFSASLTSLVVLQASNVRLRIFDLFF